MKSDVSFTHELISGLICRSSVFLSYYKDNLNYTVSIRVILDRSTASCDISITSSSLKKSPFNGISSFLTERRIYVHAWAS